MAEALGRERDHGRLLGTRAVDLAAVQRHRELKVPGQQKRGLER